MEQKSFLENIHYKSDKPQIEIIHDHSLFKDIRICFIPFQEMLEHQTAFPIAVCIMEGEIEFGVHHETLELKTGDTIYLEAKTLHYLKALSHAVVRLTIFKNQ
jgi:quercetin dioxygenase-like cupin family protein